MSVNVKLNNVVYNGIDTLMLPLANGGGYARFLLDDSGPVVALYALGEQWGDHTGNAVFDVVFNGNHARITVKPVGDTYNYLDLNMTTYTENVDDTAINNLPKWFTLPAGNAEMALRNVQNTSNLKFGVNMRKALNNTSISVPAVGTLSGSEVYSASGTLTEDTDVSCCFVYIELSGTTIKSGVIEFDYELSVDGVRYI